MAWGMALWSDTCLVRKRHWVQSLAVQEEKKKQQKTRPRSSRKGVTGFN